VAPMATISATNDVLIEFVDYVGGNRAYYGRGVTPNDKSNFDLAVFVPESPVAWPLDMPVGRAITKSWIELFEARKNDKVVGRVVFSVTEEGRYLGRERISTEMGSIDTCKITSKNIASGDGMKMFSDQTTWLAAEGEHRGRILKIENRNEAGAVESTTVVTGIITFK